MNRNYIVTIYTDCNFLSLSILENLLSKNCYVNIVSNDVKSWIAKTNHLANKNRFSILSEKTSKDISSTYAIFVLGFLEGNPYTELKEIWQDFSPKISKSLIVMPSEKFSITQNDELKFNDNFGVVYVNDLLGPRLDIRSDLFAPRLIGQIYSKRTANVPVGELLYPIFVNDAAKIISRWLFSFGPYGKESLLTGQQVSIATFLEECRRLVGEIKISYDAKGETRPSPKRIETKLVSSNLRFCLVETYKWLAQAPQVKPLRIPRKKRVYPKFVRPLVSTALVVLALPLLLLMLTACSLFFSYREFLAGNDTLAENGLLAAKTLSVISKPESRALGYIPVIGLLYRETYFLGAVGERISNIAISGIPFTRTSSDLMNKVLGNVPYDPGADSQNLKGDLDLLYMQISLLQADTTDALRNGSFSANYLNQKIDLEKLKNLTAQSKTLAENLPSLIGKDTNKTYLVLFENNMELRPTGGFIGSFGLLTFDSGRITDLTVNDVYSADGQLNGHVEPPAPIKKYLNEANWFLRDSNWDPDFPTSAKRAEWFLDKEVGRQVDGVVSVDLSPIRDVLRYTGPIFLPDFNLDITSDNLYEKTQEEVQSNFFPGTHKKASFLTALSRSLLTEISKLGTQGKLGMLKSFYAELNARSVQIFLHDDTSQSAIENMSWDGGVNVPDCGTNCYSDLVGEVEANVGDNKANYFIERSQNLEVSNTNGMSVKRLTVTLKNNANPALGAAGIYKPYVRLIYSAESEIPYVRLITGTTAQPLPPETVDLEGRRESGVMIQVLEGETKKLEFTWATDLTAKVGLDKYGIYVRKQAGVGPDPFTLTLGGKKVYNGILASDYFSRFNW